MILAFCDSEGLTVGDTKTGLTAYAYQSSYHHFVAWTYPHRVEAIAREMLLDEQICAQSTRNTSVPLGLDLIAEDKSRLSKLSENPDVRRFEAA